MNATLYKILNTQSETYSTGYMRDLMAALLFDAGASIKVDQRGNLFATKGRPPAGEFYPCIAAHLDTVHDMIPEERYCVIELGGKAVALDSQSLRFAGIGGDDKCGLYIAVQVLRSLDFCKVALFVDEESGCEGSGAAGLDFFKDCGYILQNDRTGAVDVVRQIMGTQLAAAEFCALVEPLFQSYGRRWCDTGGLTDVYTLATRGVGISCLNIACAYYNAHSPDEWIDIQGLEATLRFNLEVIEVLGSTQYTNTAKKAPAWSYGHDLYWDDAYPATRDKRTYHLPSDEHGDAICQNCGTAGNIDGDEWGLWCGSCGAYTYSPKASPPHWLEQ